MRTYIEIIYVCVYLHLYMLIEIVSFYSEHEISSKMCFGRNILYTICRAYRVWAHVYLHNSCGLHTTLQRGDSAWVALWPHRVWVWD